MYYVIYETKNLLNGKIYVGKHKTDNLNDGYLGSGINLKRAIKKYGKDNFIRSILFYLSSEEEMNIKEFDIVNEEFISRNDVYNIGIGGQGGSLFLGRSHSIESRKKISNFRKGKNLPDDVREKISLSNKNREMTPELRYKLGSGRRDKNGLGIKHTEETKKKISDSLNNLYNGEYGKEVKRKISSSMKGKNLGKTNSLYGRKFPERCGENHPNFKGWYITPNGVFSSLESASKSNGCSSRTITRNCLERIENKYNDWDFIPV